MAGTHLPQKWQAYTDTVRDGLPTRRAGEQMEVDHKTACSAAMRCRQVLSYVTFQLTVSSTKTYTIQ